MSKYVQLPTGAVTDTTQAVGVVTISTGGGGGAPTNASYLVLGTNATLTNERVLTAGTGITLTDGGAGGNLTIASSGSGGGNATTAVLDFGSGKGDYSASTVVTGQTWVTSSSSIIATAIDYTGNNSAEDAAVDGVTFAIGDLVAGTGFTVYAASPFGSVGQFKVSCVGV